MAGAAGGVFRRTPPETDAGTEQDILVTGTRIYNQKKSAPDDMTHVIKRRQLICDN